MPMRYFYKEIFSNPIIVNGVSVQFDQLDGNRGVIALDDTHPLVPGLIAAAQARKGGVSVIDEATYTQKKSRHPLRESKPRLQRETLKLMPDSVGHKPKENAQAVAAAADVDRANRVANRITEILSARGIPVTPEVKRAITSGSPVSQPKAEATAPVKPITANGIHVPIPEPDPADMPVPEAPEVGEVDVSESVPKDAPPAPALPSFKPATGRVGERLKTQKAKE